MTKEEMVLNLEDLRYNFSNYETIDCTPSDAKTIDAAINFIEYGLKLYTTDELVNEVMKREGIQTVEKVKLNDGAVG